MFAASCSAADAIQAVPKAKKRGIGPVGPSVPAASGSRGLDGSDATHDDLAAGRLDGGDGRSRRTGTLDGERSLDLTLRQQTNAIPKLRQHAELDQAFRRDRIARLELARFDSLFQATGIDHLVLRLEYVVEAALRQAPMQQGLAAFETVDGD